MPRYSSRVGVSKKSVKRVPKKRGGSIKVAGSLPVGGVAVVGGNVAPIISKRKDNVGAAISVGGGIDVGGSLDKISYPQMISVLNNMTPDQYHHLQGVAAGHVNEDHALRDITRQAIGGSFAHPKSFSPIATKDILRAVSSQQLANALHAEFMDFRKGRKTGGGLFDSLKHHFKVGLSKIRTGVPAAVSIGKKLRSALQTGLSVAKQFAPIVEQVFPSLGALAKTGIAGGEAVERALGVGIGIGEKVAEAVETIAN